MHLLQIEMKVLLKQVTMRPLTSIPRLRSSAETIMKTLFQTCRCSTRFQLMQTTNHILRMHKTHRGWSDPASKVFSHNKLSFAMKMSILPHFKNKLILITNHIHRRQTFSTRNPLPSPFYHPKLTVKCYLKTLECF